MNEAKLLDFLQTDKETKDTLKRLLNEARTILKLGNKKKIASLKLILPDINLHFNNHQGGTFRS